MSEPIQAPPVRRPQLVDAATFYNPATMSQDQIDYMRQKFAFDMNYNDPQAFNFPSADRMRVSTWPGQ